MPIQRNPTAGLSAAQEFKPNANYTWEDTQQFILIGAELNIIMKSLQVAADTPEFRRNAAIFQGLSAVNNLFKDAVEQGLIKESEAPVEQLVELQKKKPLSTAQPEFEFL